MDTVMNPQVFIMNAEDDVIETVSHSMTVNVGDVVYDHKGSFYEEWEITEIIGECHDGFEVNAKLVGVDVSY